MRNPNPDRQLPEPSGSNNKKKPFLALANTMNCGTVVHTQTYVSVCWQDGSFSDSLRATQLVPVQHMLHSDFWPEDFVVEREGEIMGGRKRVGVVKRVLAEARTCEVMWLDNQGDNKEGEGEEEKERIVEEVSTYAIEGHQDANFRLGCYVLKLNCKETLPSTSSSTTSTNSAPSSSSSSNIVDSEQVPDLKTSSSDESEEDGDDDDEEDDDDFEEDEEEDDIQGEAGNKLVGSWVGQVINIKDGVIRVQWVDGSVSTARPDEIFRIIDEDSNSSDDEYDEDEDEEYQIF